jgi:hypothetical protein
VALLTALALVILALPDVAKQFYREQLRKKTPLALSLVMYDVPLGRKITTKDTEEVKQLIRSRLDDPGRLRDCFPFRIADLTWRVEGGDSKGVVVPLKGRTLAPGDPLLEGDSCPLRAGERFPTPDQDGVILTPLMLRILKLPPDTKPGFILHARASGVNEMTPVPLVGITEAEKLPQDHHFVMTEAFENKIFFTEPDVRIKEVYRPIPPQWAKLDRLPPAFYQKLKIYQIDGPYDHPSTAAPTWRLKSKLTQGHLLSEWRARLKDIADQMEQLTSFPGKDFDKVEPPPEARPNPESRRGYDMAGVYMGDLDALKPAAQAIRDKNWMVNDDIIKSLQDIDAVCQQAFHVILLVLLVVVVIVCLKLFAVQILRIRPKVPEIGMLRTLGTEDRLLFGIYVTEALLIWIAGTLMGLLLAALTGGILLWYFNAWKELGGLFSTWYYPALAVGFLVFSLGVCWGSLYVATRQARKDPPGQSLHH